MTAHWLVVLLCASALVGGCRKTQPGDACENDEQCGSGFDCYQDTCVRVCSSASECDPGDVCERYRCKKSAVLPSGGVGVTGSGPGPVRPQPPPQGSVASAAPVPDVVGIELRAIRRELELLREEQTKLRALLENERGAAKK